MTTVAYPVAAIAALALLAGCAQNPAPADSAATASRFHGEQVEMRAFLPEAHDREADELTRAACRQHDALGLVDVARDAAGRPRPVRKTRLDEAA